MSVDGSSSDNYSPSVSSTAGLKKVVKKTRVRRTHEKSHFGCATCRQRRIKCDEQKPTCGRCKIAGIQCPGSGPRQSMARLHFMDLSRDELRCLQYFREKTCKVLAGHFYGEFWTSAVLRLSYTDETLQRFVVAVGSLDESFSIRSLGYRPIPEDPMPSFSFALHQYGSALKGVIQQANEGTVSVCLLASSVLCLMFELWLGNVSNARDHAFAAQRFLSQWDTERSGTVSAESDEILTKYLRPMIFKDCSQLSLLPPIQAETLTNSIAPTISECLQSKLIHQTSFANYEEAQAHYQELTRLIVTRVRAYIALRDPRDLRLPWTKLEGHLIHWYKRLLELDARVMPGSRPRTAARCLLEVRFRVFFINIICLPFNDEMLYDNHLDDFTAIVDAIEEFFKLSGISASTRGTRRTQDLQTTMALAFVGFKCRDPQLRRRAIRLLYRYRTVEGIWSSVLAGIIAEQSMILEEEGLGHITRAVEILPSRRIKLKMMGESSQTKNEANVDPAFATPTVRGLTLVYTRGSTNDTALQKSFVPFTGYPVVSTHGVKSMAYFADYEAAELLNEEIPNLNRDRDWPHMGNTNWTVYMNPDLETACNMETMVVDIWQTQTSESGSPFFSEEETPATIPSVQKSTG